jgi:hypothetical protein
MTITDTDELRALLADRASAVEPHRPPVSVIASRSARRRRQRRIAAATVAAAATVSVVVGAAAVARHGATDRDPATVSVAGPGGASGPASTVAPPAPGAGPLRIGLAADEPVAAVLDDPDAEVSTTLPQSLAIDYRNADGSRQLTIISSTGSAPPGPWVDPQPLDLGDGVVATLSHVPPGPSTAGGAILVDWSRDGAQLTLSATGLTTDELRAAASSVVPIDGGARFDAPGVPADLHAGAPRSPAVGGAGVRSSIEYHLANGVDAVVDVSDGPPGFAPDPTSSPTATAPEVSVIDVHGQPATVRRFTDMATITVTWSEPTNHVVSIRFTALSPSTPLDPVALTAGVRQLSEDEFQALLAQHPGH